VLLIPGSPGRSLFYLLNDADNVSAASDGCVRLELPGPVSPKWFPVYHVVKAGEKSNMIYEVNKNK
jgi:hypothetical protein